MESGRALSPPPTTRDVGIQTATMENGRAFSPPPLTCDVETQSADTSTIECGRALSPPPQKRHVEMQTQTDETDDIPSLKIDLQDLKMDLMKAINTAMVSRIPVIESCRVM